jgi:predicted enzyme related to lactoylglutathione lyase
MMRKPGVPAHWLPYFQVADADASTANASGGGATVIVPPMNVDKSLRIAVLADPQGAVFALFQP